jgi:hypothetical protein
MFCRYRYFFKLVFSRYDASIISRYIALIARYKDNDASLYAISGFDASKRYTPGRSRDTISDFDTPHVVRSKRDTSMFIR